MKFADALLYLFFEALDSCRNEVSDVYALVHQRRQIHRVVERGVSIAGVTCGEGSVCEPSPLCREIITLAACDLAVEHGGKSAHEVGVRPAVKKDLLVVAEPIEIAPHLAAKDLLGPILRLEETKRRDDPERRRNVRLVFIGQVVGVKILRVRPLDERGELFDDRAFPFFDCLRGMP